MGSSLLIPAVGVAIGSLLHVCHSFCIKLQRFLPCFRADVVAYVLPVPIFKTVCRPPFLEQRLRGVSLSYGSDLRIAIGPILATLLGLCPLVAIFALLYLMVGFNYFFVSVVRFWIAL